MGNTHSRRKLKVIEDSTIEVSRAVEEWRDANGILHKRVTKNILDKPLNLGSINKPENKDIVNIKFIVPRRIQSGMGLVDFRKLFRG